MSSQHVAIIGGSSGIGLATAGHLLEKGYRVTITGRDAAKLQAAEQSLDGDIAAVTMDAADFAGLAEAFQALGPVDHLVLALGGGNGAGPFAGLHQRSHADLRRRYPFGPMISRALPVSPGNGALSRCERRPEAA